MTTNFKSYLLSKMTINHTMLYIVNILLYNIKQNMSNKMILLMRKL